MKKAYGSWREGWEEMEGRGGLSLIRSPKFSRDFGFYGFAAEHNGFTYTLIPTLTLIISLSLLWSTVSGLLLKEGGLLAVPTECNSC